MCNLWVSDSLRAFSIFTAASVEEIDPLMSTAIPSHAMARHQVPGRIGPTLYGDLEFLRACPEGGAIMAHCLTRVIPREKTSISREVLLVAKYLVTAARGSAAATCAPFFDVRARQDEG